jgi:hypothetical protein
MTGVDDFNNMGRIVSWNGNLYSQILIYIKFSYKSCVLECLSIGKRSTQIRLMEVPIHFSLHIAQKTKNFIHLAQICAGS